MYDMNLELVRQLSRPVAALHEKALKLVEDERGLNKQFLDSSVYLLVIIQLRDANEATRWLQSIGLTYGKIEQFIMYEFDSRERPKKKRDAWGKLQPPPSGLTQYTAAAQGALNRMTTIGNTPEYAAEVLKAVISSDESRTVNKIFRSVGLNMPDVRHIWWQTTGADRNRRFL